MFFLCNFMPLLRMRRFIEDFRFLRRFIGWGFDILVLFITGFLLEVFMLFLWFQVPAWHCGSTPELHERFRLLDCLNKDCNIFQLKSEEDLEARREEDLLCLLRQTWFVFGEPPRRMVPPIELAKLEPDFFFVAGVVPDCEL